jgi:hypothetical protein
MKHAGFMLIFAILCFNFIAFSPDLIGIDGDAGLNPALGSFIPG